MCGVAASHQRHSNQNDERGAWTEISQYTRISSYKSNALDQNHLTASKLQKFDIAYVCVRVRLHITIEATIDVSKHPLQMPTFADVVVVVAVYILRIYFHSPHDYAISISYFIASLSCFYFLLFIINNNKTFITSIAFRLVLCVTTRNWFCRFLASNTQSPVHPVLVHVSQYSYRYIARQLRHETLTTLIWFLHCCYIRFPIRIKFEPYHFSITFLLHFLRMPFGIPFSIHIIFTTTASMKMRIQILILTENTL